MIISEARNLLEMRKTESSATHKSLRKAQAKTAQANAKPQHLQEELMAIVKFFDERFRTILLADPIHGPLPDFSGVAPEAFWAGLFGAGLLFDVQYDDAEESRETKVRLHSNKGRKWRRRPPAAAAVAAARGVVDMELEQEL